MTDVHVDVRRAGSSIVFSGGGTASPTLRTIGYDDNITNVTEAVMGGPSGTTTRSYDDSTG